MVCKLSMKEYDYGDDTNFGFYILDFGLINPCCKALAEYLFVA